MTRTTGERMAVDHVFCINPGRSGSDYLTELFCRAANAVSVHEGVPLLNGQPMRAWNAGDEAELRALLPAKLRAMDRGRRGRIYCETNHSFIKGWGWLLPDEFLPQDRIGVVILRRDPEKVARSLLRVHDIPGKTEWGRTWYLTPGQQRNVCEPPAGAGPLDLCRWYVREVNLRAEAYRERFPRITYFDCELEQLNDRAFVRELFAAFGLRPGPRLDGAVGRVVNPRDEWPRVPVEELLAPPRYPSADDLPPSERDALLADLVAHLRRHHAGAVAALQPDETMAGTYALGCTRLVADAERELEDAFRVGLVFTDTEMILIHELLRSVAPRDVAFLAHRRVGPPGVRYEFEYNAAPTPARILRHLGPAGLLRVAWLAARGRWRRDFSHRVTAAPPR